jgi:hypothetical protein
MGIGIRCADTLCQSLLDTTWGPSAQDPICAPENLGSCPKKKSRPAAWESGSKDPPMESCIGKRGTGGVSQPMQQAKRCPTAVIVHYRVQP